MKTGAVNIYVRMTGIAQPEIKDVCMPLWWQGFYVEALYKCKNPPQYNCT